MKYKQPSLDFRDFLLGISSLGLTVAGLLGIWRSTQIVHSALQSDTLTVRSWFQILIVISILAAGLLGLLQLLWSRSLYYVIDRNTIEIQWWGGQHTIPLDALSNSTSDSRPHQNFGHGLPAQIVEVQTEQSSYRLALADASAFSSALEQRRSLGTTQPRTEGPTHRWPMWIAWRTDQLVQRALFGAIALIIIGWSFICWRYPALASTIVLRFDPLGGTLGPRPRSTVWFLPTAGLLLVPVHIGLAVLLHQRLPSTSQFVMLSLVLVQLMLVVALIFVTLR